MPTQFRLCEVTPGQGQRWLAYVEQSGPGHLTRLAQLLEASSGPIEKLDGTLASLDSLFEWHVPFLEKDGMGLIDREERLPLMIALGNAPVTMLAGEPIPWTPNIVLSPLITAYVFEVVRRIDPSAHWASWPRPPETRIIYSDDNRVGVMFRGEWKIIDSFVLSATPRRPGEDWTDPAQRPTRDKLRRDVAARLGVNPELPQPRQESILLPLLEHPVALPEIPRLGQKTAIGEPASEGPRLDADPVMFLDRSVKDDDLETAPPLALGPVMNLLLGLGATTLEGDLITRRRMLGEADQFVILDGAVLVETLVVKRKVRAILFEPGTATPAEWLHLLSRLDVAGADLGAHVVPTEGL